MSDLTNPIAAISRTLLIAVLTTFVIAAVTACAWSQTAPPPVAPKSVIIQVMPGPAAPTPPVAPLSPTDQPPPAPENPGLVSEIGKLFRNSTSLLPSMPALPSLGSDSLTRLNTVVKGRMVCPVSANGAPDCKTASDRLCQSKGFKEGKSLDTDAAQTCSPKAMIPGRKPEEGDCRTDNYVTQALCQ